MNDLDVLPGAIFLVPDLGDKVDSGIGLSSRPARCPGYIGWQAGIRQPYAGVNYMYIPNSGTINLATGAGMFL